MAQYCILFDVYLKQFFFTYKIYIFIYKWDEYMIALNMEENIIKI